MLYTDSDLITEQMLSDLEAEVPEVADSQDISLSAVIRNAWDECADDITEKLDSFGGVINIVNGTTSYAAYLTSNLGQSRSRVFLSQIVASDRYAGRVPTMQRWMAYRALILFYRDASHRLGTDRYEQKMVLLQADAKRRWAALWTYGCPIVAQPLARPGAVHELNSGTWTQDNVASAAMIGTAPAQTVRVAITWLDTARYVSPTNKQNGESAPSDAVELVLAANQTVAVDITSLVAPGIVRYGGQTIGDGILVPLKATHWNLYAGKPGGELYLQNVSPIPVGTLTYTPAALSFAGTVADPGQVGDARLSFQNTFQRA